MTALFEIGPADVADTSNDYYTPRWIFDAAGLVFDMDVAAPVDPSRRTCPARRYLTVIEDGLSHPWGDGLVWMNPPYSAIRLWVDRFAAHRHGLALLPAVKGKWLGPLLHCADAVTLLSVDFGRPDGSEGMFSHLLLLAGCGEACIEAVSRVAAADRYAVGAYHVRPDSPVTT